MSAALATQNARARSSRIRMGIHSYLETLGDIAAAYAERDWIALDYEDWQSYVDGEFGAERLRLPPAHRQKAVEELRLAGMSQRAIATATGLDRETVAKDLREAQVAGFQPPATVQGADGKSYPSTREPEPAPLVAAVTAAIEGVVERAENGPTWADHELALRTRMEAGETVVVSMRAGYANLIRWAEESGLYVRIDRRTDWGNPFELPADGDRDAVIQSYAVHYIPFKPSLLSRLDTLRGKALGCWCAPERCHGDVLAELVEPC